MSAFLKGRAARAMKSPAYPKFAATVDQAGVPNVVPLLSAKMIDPETMAFVRFMVWKTARNFEANRKISFACRGPAGRSYVVKGEFVEWVTQGPLLERFEEEPLYRYNAYMGANQVGRVKVKEVLEFAGTGFLRSLLSGLPPRPAPIPENGRGPMAPQVMEKWRRRLALKFVGLTDENGDPLAFPANRLTALDSRTLFFSPPADPHPLARLKDGTRVAASVFCFDPVAYQVKGRFAGREESRGLARIEVTEVYSASPPLPGLRIYPPESDL